MKCFGASKEARTGTVIRTRMHPIDCVLQALSSVGDIRRSSNASEEVPRTRISSYYCVSMEGMMGQRIFSVIIFVSWMMR